MQNPIQAFFSRIKDTPIEFTLRAGILVIFVVFLMDLTVYFIKGEIDLEGVLIEAHGMIFDIILFGLVLAYYNHRLQKKREEEDKKREKNNRIRRYTEEIEDFKGWNEKEAMYKNVGNIRRLNRMGVSNINLRQSYLESGKLDRANFEGANLFMANLKNVDLTGAVLRHSSLNYANLKGANLEGADLRDSDLSNAKFVVAKLKDIDFRGCKFSETTLEDCILVGAKVDNPNWFQQLLEESGHAEMIERLKRKYTVNRNVNIDNEGKEFFRIERCKKQKATQ